MTVDEPNGRSLPEAGPGIMTAGEPAERVPGSLRRTSSIDVTWPAGPMSHSRVDARARDLLTPSDGSPARVLAEYRADVAAAPDRTIERVATYPHRDGIERLVGGRAGHSFRGQLAAVVPDDLRHGTGLYLLLDDLAGATLIARFAFWHWPGEGNSLARPNDVPASNRRMEGVCIGFRPGSSSLTQDGGHQPVRGLRRVQELPDPADPLSWHQMQQHREVSMRRARRIDVTIDGAEIRVDSMFQDSATTPDGGRVAVHQYKVTATADARTSVLQTISAEPRVLPYQECTLAPANVPWLIGTPLRELRTAVLERLKGTNGCTHLNDAVRALAEVPALAARLSR